MKVEDIGRGIVTGVETGIKVEQTVESAALTIASIVGFAVDKFLLVFEKAVAASPTLLFDFLIMDARNFNITGQHLIQSTSIFSVMEEELLAVEREIAEIPSELGAGFKATRKALT